jgi:energy-coupling factor transporter transmembrane protein EcfT
LSDASTPPARRARILFLGLALVFLACAVIDRFFLLAVAAAAGLSVAMSARLIGRAFRQSPSLGLASFPFTLLGNLAFLAGSLRGLAAGRAPEAN